MKATFLILVAILALSLSIPCQASEDTSVDLTIGGMLQAERGEYLDKLSVISGGDDQVFAAREFNDFPSFGSEMYSSEHKSIGRAFVYSALVPGLGEYYAGSKFKSALFFAADLVFWSQYLSNHSKGKDKEDEFTAYADAHWSATRYTEWLVENYGVLDDEDPYEVPGEDPKSFTHNLPDEKTQQYYEMIGKYEQFLAGWDDYDEQEATSSPRRGEYIIMRDDANDKLNKASTWVMVSLANHFLSAFDAAITAKSFNKRKDVFSNVNVKARLAKYDGDQIPQLMFTYKFF